MTIYLHLITKQAVLFNKDKEIRWHSNFSIQLFMNRHSVDFSCTIFHSAMAGLVPLRERRSQEMKQLGKNTPLLYLRSSQRGVGVYSGGNKKPSMHTVRTLCL